MKCHGKVEADIIARVGSQSAKADISADISAGISTDISADISAEVSANLSAQISPYSLNNRYVQGSSIFC